MSYKKHKYNFFPEIENDSYQELKQSISKGFDVSLGKITLFEGDVLDGWNRLKACIECGISPIFTYFTGTSEEAFRFSITANQNRRHLTSSQLAAVALNAEPIWNTIKAAVEQEKREKQRIAQLSNEEAKRSQTPDQLVALIPPTGPPKQKPESEARHKLGEVFNTNGRYISDAKKIKETAPEVFKKIESGEMSIPEAKKKIAVEKRTAEIEKQKFDIENNEVTKLSGLYDVISIDPPWNYGREYDPENSRVANPYPEMTVAEIKNIVLPVTENAVLFLWTTHKFLPDAFEILKTWQFEYKATLVWNKEKIGMGAWFRMQCEFCLFAIKGKPLWSNTTERDIITEGRREHSRKPDTFFDMANKLCTGRKLEYFAREKREGWDIFGNDTNKF